MLSSDIHQSLLLNVLVWRIGISISIISLISFSYLSYSSCDFLNYISLFSMFRYVPL